ncbi:hypothetical protein MTR67_044508, partial [Solanum verrucosum]
MELESLNRSSNMVDEIRNEIDKECIRKEIVAEEVARKQMLKLEVRREIMMEREITMFGGDRFASFFKNQADSMSFKEKLGMGVSAVSRHDMDHISKTHFRHRAVETNISTLNQSPKAEILEVLPPSLSKILLLVERPCDDMISSPNVNDPPSLLIDNNADDLRNNTANEKENNREFTFWCETCKIGTFSEKTMEAHRFGKKHVQHLQQLT